MAGCDDIAILRYCDVAILRNSLSVLIGLPLNTFEGEIRDRYNGSASVNGGLVQHQLQLWCDVVKKIFSVAIPQQKYEGRDFDECDV